MFNNLKLLILLAVSALVAFWVTRDASENDVVNQAIFPQWSQQSSLINDLDRVVLSQDGQQLVLQRQDNRWTLNDGFFAAVEPLVKLIRSVNNAKIVEAKTALSENHSRLQLADNDLKVSFFHGDEPAGALIVGKNSASGHTFIRRAGEDQTYLVSGLEPISFNASSWQLKTIVDINAEELKSITIEPTEGGVIEVMKVDDQWQLMNLPTGQQLKSDAYLDQLASALTRFLIDDALPKNMADKDLVMTGHYVLNNEQKIKVQLYQQDESYYVTLDSDLHPHYADWMMQIAEYKFNSLNRKLEEYIEPAAAVEEEAESAGQASE